MLRRKKDQNHMFAILALTVQLASWEPTCKYSDININSEV